MILFKKKEKKDMAPLSIKRFGIPVVPLLDPVHLSSKHPRTYVQRFESNDEGDIFPERGGKIPVQVGK